MTWPGIAGALILLALSPVYLRQCLRGTTRPHPVSWGIWATLAVLGAAATAAAGGGGAVIVLGAIAAIEVAVFVAAVWRAGALVSLRELWPLIPAAIGAALWIVSQNPLAGAIGVVVADICGLWPTLAKTWQEPRSEPPLLWAIGTGAFLLGCFSVSTLSVASLLYPVYLTVSNSLIAGVAWTRREHVRVLRPSPWSS